MRAERIMLILCMGAVVVVVFGGVLMRYTPFPGRTVWTAELARFFLLLTAFWAAGSIERVKGHFKFDLLTTAANRGRWQLGLESFIKLIVMFSIGMVIWATFSCCENLIGVETTMLHWPAIMRPLTLLCGSSLMFVYMLFAFIRNLQELFKR